MTIHSEHPFTEPPDPVRRFRGRIGGAVSLWTSGAESARAGLTVSSLMVANGDPAAVVGLLDPDSDLHAALVSTGRGVVQLLNAADRELADAFGGVAPAPGGAFRIGTWEQTAAGPALLGRTRAEVRYVESREVGWSALVVAEIEAIHLEADSRPLEHRRGRYLHPRSGDGR
ncbi:flavin reductase family protein [Nocardioides marmorisolisilvae]|uniref:Flavin reductase n=1 Tax=Nocardioides marmorisolisilvae TaxID=1542737 RepID=A0A3N0DTY9_9ACTN|nr:flavin reductase family protein [Nocardioides marmorisolisilvae]RNL79097.1 flavin reductase [Nocardioides marmorisolisilvae]